MTNGGEIRQFREPEQASVAPGSGLLSPAAQQVGRASSRTGEKLKIRSIPKGFLSSGLLSHGRKSGEHPREPDGRRWGERPREPDLAKSRARKLAGSLAHQSSPLPGFGLIYFTFAASNFSIILRSFFNAMF